ncbi:helix-turn-helix domain-containing protein [Agrobacterium radiobacter]|uniref:helix-turn-helix domain-containing protein n=1 Tax=Agrobacterium radiobacter TaxID=362 RepID=UPI003467C28E
MTAKDLATKVSISAPYLSEIESGKKPEASPSCENRSDTQRRYRRPGVSIASLSGRAILTPMTLDSARQLPGMMRMPVV